MANLKSNDAFGNSSISVKAADNASVDKLKDEVTGVLRAHRRLKPKEENNFALNEISAIGEAFDPFFKALNLMGLVVGIFAIFVGIFNIQRSEYHVCFGKRTDQYYWHQKGPGCQKICDPSRIFDRSYYPLPDWRAPGIITYFCATDRPFQYGVNGFRNLPLPE
jgi:hypothetical protein